MPYSDIAIIFNPNSTGDAPGNAKRLRDDIAASLPHAAVQLLPTEYAGHAEMLAYEFAKNHKNPLIVAASGDGGYNEVINGALRAEKEGADPTCAVLPSGNANDHARTMQEKPLLELILQEEETRLDVLHFTARLTDGTIKTRYAHSYIGVGLTPKVAIELNKHKLNIFQEAWILFKTLSKLRPVYLRLDDQEMYVDSLTASIIPEMAKVLTLSPEAKPRDGLFEVATLRHRSKPALILNLFKGAVTHLGANRRADDLVFTLLRPSPVQMDGEIIQLPKNSEVRITVQQHRLRTVASVIS